MSSFFGILKKARDYLAPPVIDGLLDEFKEACNTITDGLEGKCDLDESSLEESLNRMEGDLIEELGATDTQCYEYLMETSALAKIADAFNSNLKPEFVPHIMEFFLAFVNTKLNAYFPQQMVRTSLLALCAKLTEIDKIAPAAVLDFTTKLWDATAHSTLVMEMLSIQGENPIIAFMVHSVCSIKEIGAFSRQAILKLCTEGDEAVFEVIQPKLYRHFDRYLIGLCNVFDCVNWEGEGDVPFMWIDQFVYRTQSYRLQNLLKAIKEFPPIKQLLSYAFFLTHFTLDTLLREIVTEVPCDLLSNALKDENLRMRHSGFLLLKAILLSGCDIQAFFPPVHEPNPSRINEVFELNEDPKEEWNSFFNERPKGSNPEIFSILLGLLKQFGTLSINTELSLANLLLIFFSAAPDLLGDEFIDAYLEAKSSFADVEAVPLDETSQDTPGTKLAILNELGKNIRRVQN